jgi:r-opsin
MYVVITGCKIYGFIGGLSGTASIMTLSAIALDRYTVIAYPLNPMKRTTSARAIIMVSAVWVYSGIFSSLPLLGLNGYVSEGYLTSCSFDYLSDRLSDRIFVFVFFLAAWAFPLSLIVFSYNKIFNIVRSAERQELFNPYHGGTSLTRESFKCK